MRITNNLAYMRALQNIARNHEDLFKVQNKLTTGKSFVKPSENPLGMSKSIYYRNELSKNSQYVNNIDYGISYLSNTESILSEIDSIVVRAKEIALEGANDFGTEQGLEGLKDEVEKLLEQALDLSNSTFKGKFIFGGFKTDEEPFEMEEDGQVIYKGDDGITYIPVSSSLEMPINIIGKQVFTGSNATINNLSHDLDPLMDEDTLLRDINLGAGIAPGVVRVTDREGNVTNIDLSRAVNIGDVIETINGNRFVNVQASIDEENRGLVIRDTSLNPVEDQWLHIEDVGNGKTANDLGILGDDEEGIIEGRDMNPALSDDTDVDLIGGGDPIVLRTIFINNGDQEAAVDLGFCETVGDILDEINNSGIQVQASISSEGKGIKIKSLIPDTELIIRDEENSDTAAQLGLQGSAVPETLFSILLDLKTALESEDLSQINESVDKFNDALDAQLKERSIVGARIKSMDLLKNRYASRQVDIETLVSDTEDVNYAEAIMDYSVKETVFQASLYTASQVMSNSLLNFLR